MRAIAFVTKLIDDGKIPLFTYVRHADPNNTVSLHELAWCLARSRPG
jgi:hypothetical protein